MTVRAHWSVESLSPLHFAVARSRGASTETLRYIPGTAVRGALAAAFLAAHDVAAPEFRPLIEDTQFSHLYPAVAEAPAASVPLPLSSVTCSHLPGFRGDGGHGVGDVLLPAEAALLAAEAAAAPDEVSVPARPPTIDIDSLLRCRQCSEERQRLPVPVMIPWRGYCAWQHGTPRLAPIQVGATIERPTDRPSSPTQQPVAVRQTLAAGQRFSGTVTFPDAATADLAAELLQMQDHRLWVGAGRSRGLGAVHVTAAGGPAAPDRVESRQQGMMATLADRCRQADVSLPGDRWYVTLTLRSAALVPDAFGRWQQTMGADMLGQWSGLPASAWQLRQARVAATAISGWNAVLGLPKPDATAIAAGSCWLFRVQDVSLDDLTAALERLEESGIGERRQEGYGVISVCDPLHWQVQELEGEHQAS